MLGGIILLCYSTYLVDKSVNDHTSFGLSGTCLFFIFLNLTVFWPITGAKWKSVIIFFPSIVVGLMFIIEIYYVILTVLEIMTDEIFVNDNMIEMISGSTSSAVHIIAAIEGGLVGLSYRGGLSFLKSKNPGPKDQALILAPGRGQSARP